MIGWLLAVAAAGWIAGFLCGVHWHRRRVVRRIDELLRGAKDDRR